MRRADVRRVVLDLVHAHLAQARRARHKLLDALARVRTALEHGTDAVTLRRAAEELRAARRTAGLAAGVVLHRVDLALAATAAGDRDERNDG